MKRILLASFVLFLTISIVVPIAEAHVLVTDKNIGAVLHIDPEDDPIAGQQSGFFFEFKDTTNKFEPQNCTCNFYITENGQTIYSQPLFQNSDTSNVTNASIFYTFPKRDVYQIHVVGKPNKPDAFQPFILNYDIRVDRIADQKAVSGQNDNTPQKNTAYLWIIIIFILAGAIIVVVYRNKKKRDKGGREKDTGNMY